MVRIILHNRIAAQAGTMPDILHETDSGVPLQDMRFLASTGRSPPRPIA